MIPGSLHEGAPVGAPDMGGVSPPNPRSPTCRLALSHHGTRPGLLSWPPPSPLQQGNLPACLPAVRLSLPYLGFTGLQLLLPLLVLHGPCAERPKALASGRRAPTRAASRRPHGRRAPALTLSGSPARNGPVRRTEDSATDAPAPPSSSPRKHAGREK